MKKTILSLGAFTLFAVPVFASAYLFNPIAVTCSPTPVTISVGQSATFSATVDSKIPNSGTASHIFWQAYGATNFVATGGTFTTSYTAPGTYEVSALFATGRGSGTGICEVIVQ